MKIEEALKEKRRVQRLLSESAKDIHDYFERSHRAATQAMSEMGTAPHYARRQRQEATANTESASHSPTDSA